MELAKVVDYCTVFGGVPPPRNSGTKNGVLRQLIFFYPHSRNAGGEENFLPPSAKFFKIEYRFSKFSTAQNLVKNGNKCTRFQPGQLRSKPIGLEGFRPPQY